MDKIEELREDFVLNNLTEKKEFEDRFNKIAKNLFNNFIIKTSYGDFRFEEIEFYFHSKKHPDYIAHPRKSEPLIWYINDFGGIDINFKSEAKKQIPNNPWSKYCWDEESYYGGILIRQLKRISDEFILDSPLKVAELFRNLGCATEGHGAMPQLVYVEDLPKIELEPKPQTRNNLVKSSQTDEDYRKKLKTISSWYSDIDLTNKVDSYKKQVAKGYRYINITNKNNKNNKKKRP